MRYGEENIQKKKMQLNENQDLYYQEQERLSRIRNNQQ